MNIRDFIFINKAKTTDRIKILELLGFETETVISSAPETYVDLEDNADANSFKIYDDQNTKINTGTIQSPIESYIKDTEEIYSNTQISNSESIEHPTETFKPVNVTSKIKRIWTDVESRREWVKPLIIGIIVITITATAFNTFTSRNEAQEEVVAISSNLANETNTLVNGLENVLEISTDVFYSKYDISNASAYLQSVESSTLEYQSLISQKEDADLQSINYNLSTIFNLINELDNLLAYRILVSEILIYDNILEIDETTEVDVLTTTLSEITATSKRNYTELPNIEEMNNHKNLINTAIVTAEDLHGRLLAALRNAEYEVVNSIASALLLNKETELAAFENSLDVFKTNKTAVFQSIQNLD
tara:strand:+ start:461 stop:1546 length:1086 start_codon:yes stop_codon:yes gene_type:complete